MERREFRRSPFKRFGTPSDIGEFVLKLLPIAVTGSVAARQTAFISWTSLLHRAMQNEIGRQLRSEFDLPRERIGLLLRGIAGVRSGQGEICCTFN
jgi:hypothetical protein